MLVVGVGGQGILTLSRVLAEAALDRGYNVIVSEVHGMAQRGGSVAVHVRISLNSNPLAPLIPKGGADIIVALECHEALRHIDYLSKNGVLVLNRRVIPPAIPKVKVYSVSEIAKILNELGIKYYDINAEELALRMGKPYVANIIVLGYLAGLNILPLSRENYVNAIKKVFPERIVLDNIRAFNEGYSYAERILGKDSSVMRAR
ncbi:MAG TPA: indolepyruvate ferredoxin oxidoreductase subunit beta [Desulfurococcales archaeon]|nr:indolepyruvate ferredoxin oxidoreductase subunit beta [Desulfurococcales archaeon]